MNISTRILLALTLLGIAIIWAIPWGGDYRAALAQSPPVEVSISDTNAEEGEDLVFTVSLSSPFASELTLRYGTVLKGTARPEDFHGVDGSIIIQPQQTQATIAIRTIEDDKPEPGETVILRLYAMQPSLPGGVVFAGNPAAFWKPQAS